MVVGVVGLRYLQDVWHSAYIKDEAPPLALPLLLYTILNLFIYLFIYLFISTANGLFFKTVNEFFICCFLCSLELLYR